MRDRLSYIIFSCFGHALTNRDEFGRILKRARTPDVRSRVRIDCS